MFFGGFITADDIDFEEGHGKSIQSFNTNLQKQLAPFVFEIDKADKGKLHETFYVAQPLWKKKLLFLPAFFGWLLHAPLYYPLKKFIINRAFSTDHFDSLVVAILFLSYPIYVCLFTLVLFLITAHWSALLLLIIFPITAWSFMHLKKQMD